ARGRSVARGLPQGHHPRLLQRGGPARDQLQALPVLGQRIPGAARPGRERERRRHPAHQDRERGLGPRHFDDRADRAELHLDPRLTTRRALGGELLLGAWETGARGHELRRPLALLAAALPGTPPASLSTLPVATRDLELLRLRALTFGPELAVLGTCP